MSDVSTNSQSPSDYNRAIIVTMKEHPQLYLKCAECDVLFEYNGHKRRNWCSPKCKMKAWRKSKIAKK